MNIIKDTVAVLPYVSQPEDFGKIVDIADDVVAIIPCAGMGTRMFPQTVKIPKEMISTFAEVDGELLVLPAIHRTVLKILEAGVKDIRIVISKDNEMIKDYFRTDYSELISDLRKKGKDKIADRIEAIPYFSDDKFIYQSSDYYGNAVPLYSSLQHISAGKWILYIYPDDTFTGKNEFIQIFEAYNNYKSSILPSIRDSHGKDKYAYSDGRVVSGSGGDALKVLKIVEKPASSGLKIDSDLASVKGYLLSPAIAGYVDVAYNQFDGVGEFMIQPIIQTMIDDGHSFFAVKIDGEYHDLGNPTGYLKYVSSYKY